MRKERLSEKSTVEIAGMAISSIEFSGKMALVIFTAGCMLRCPYCHNPNSIEGGDTYNIDEVFQKIDESIDFIDSVVISGGEPLIQDNAVFKILNYAKSLGLETKLDTNGYYPEKLEKTLALVDYVAMDIKAPFAKYEEIIGADIGSKVRRSMEICNEYPETFLECRTTYVPALMKPEDIVEIAKSIKCNLYTLQQFSNKTVLDERLKEAVMPLRDDVKQIAESLKPFQKNIKIKTYEFGEELII